MRSDTSAPACCALCAQPLEAHSVTNGNEFFCCHGCSSVFNILSAKNQLEGFENHPIFKQALRSGLISNPALLMHIRQQQAETENLEREKIYFEISNMWCPSCAELIRLMLLKERGVINCVVDYATDLASVEYTPRIISKEKIKDTVAQLGYNPVSIDNREAGQAGSELHWKCAVAAFCSLNIMMLAYPLYATYFDYDGEGYGLLFAWLSLLLSFPVLFYSALPIWKRFTVSLKSGFFGMETLVAIGVGAAFLVSLEELSKGGTHVYFDSMCVIIFFVLLGKIIELRAKFSAKESLFRLTRSTPRRGRKRDQNGCLHYVPIKDISKGDLLIAYTGEKIVLDGIVCEGEGAADESLMTGEALPVKKKPNDRLLGGSLLVQGWISYRVTHSLEESLLSRILESVEKDIRHKSGYIRATDAIVRWFVPCVLILAILTGIYYFFFPYSEKNSNQAALVHALSVLLISCPCALGIAAPAAESFLLNRLAGLGALVRNRAVLPQLGKETVFIFDKTGTVTEGTYSVLSGLEQISTFEREVLAALTAHSIHPISTAIARHLVNERPTSLDQIEERAGLGIWALCNGSEYFLGSAKFLSNQTAPTISELEASSSDIVSKVYFIKDKKVLTAIYLGDRIKKDVPELLSSLKPAQLILLSGDAEKPVSSVAQQCGFDAWLGNAAPLEKRELVQKLREKGEIVCMVGDGINDAPALTLAQIAISVVSATDISIQVSDLLLTTDRIQVIKEIRQLAIKGQKIIRQNLFWAFFYNLIGMILAITGYLSPVFAAVAMSLSSLCVLFNAKRLEKARWF